MEKKSTSSKKKTGIAIILAPATVSTASSRDCNPSCRFIVINETMKNQTKGKRTCVLDPDRPVDLRPIKKRVSKDSDPATYQAARRSDICLALESKVIEWVHGDKIRKMFDF